MRCVTPRQRPTDASGEPFNLDATDATILIPSVIIEMPILHRCVLAIIHTHVTSTDLQRNAPNPSTETSAIYCVDASPDLLRAEAQRPDLHPTAAIRLIKLADHLSQDTFRP